MLKYAPPVYRPATVASPTIRRQTIDLGQTFDNYFGMSSAMGDGIRLTFHTLTAFLGFHVFVRDKGFWRWFGLALAAGQSIGAVCDALSLIQRLVGTHPAEAPPPPQRTATPNA